MKHSWRWVNENLSALPEDEVLAMLNEERAVHKRVTFLERLHQRYCALRDARERVEILKEAVK
jgi:hypothetical protein